DLATSFAENQRYPRGSRLMSTMQRGRASWRWPSDKRSTPPRSLVISASTSRNLRPQGPHYRPARTTTCRSVFSPFIERACGGRPPAYSIRCRRVSSLTGHLDRGIDGVFEIVRVIGRRLVSIAEVHAIIAGAHLAQSEPEMARNRFGFLERHGASTPLSIHVYWPAS